FRTDSDTEVLLHLYAKMGEAMFHRLRGMFAFAIWDLNKRALLLARDPYGIKPLYYSDVAGTVRFASQVKALLAGRRISREAEPAGWVGFFLLAAFRNLLRFTAISAPCQPALPYGLARLEFVKREGIFLFQRHSRKQKSEARVWRQPKSRNVCGPG